MILEVLVGKPLKSVSQGNLFLRCLWAHLADRFEGMAWQYTPRWETETQTIHFGWLSLGEEQSRRLAAGNRETIGVSISYKVRGVAHRIIFDIPDSYGELYDIDSLKGRISECVRFAADNFENPSLRVYSVKLFPFFSSDLPDISTKAFRIKKMPDGNTFLSVTTHCYGDEDGRDHAANLSSKYASIISAWTGHLVFAGHLPISLENPNINQSVLPQLTFNENASFQLSTICSRRFQNLMAVDFLESKNATSLIKAALLIQKAMLLASLDRSEFGDTANTMLISALEVLSDQGVSVPNCKTCGTPRFKISQRVRDYAAVHLGDHLRWRIRDLYNERSKFLHTGAIKARRTYSGRSIPLIQLGGVEGCALPKEFSFNHVLLYLTVLIFRRSSRASFREYSCLKKDNVD